MRLHIIALLVLALGAQAFAGAAYSQGNVTLHEKNVPLLKVLKSIRAQTGVGFGGQDLSGASGNPVTISVTNVPVDEALDQVFKNQPYTYELIGQIIVIKSKNPAPPAADSTYPRFQTVHITGTVYNDAGQPLAGANVTIRQTEKGTITNARGDFDLGNVPVGNTVIISYVGYAPEQVKVKEAASVKIYLKAAKNELDKVVIQAYGKTTERLQTGDIATVSSAEIEKQPVLNPILALQGEVPGLNIQATSGYASAPVKVELRGRTSLDNGFPSDPLYIIDGVPLTVVEVSGESGYDQGSVGFLQNGGLTGPAIGQSPLFSINPADIESISVLKDADATAIYGSRGANGVILITTKRGKAGKSKFTLTGQQGATKATKFWQMLNTPQYLAMRREAFKNDGITPDPSTAYDLMVWDTTRYTDWQRYLLGGTGQYTQLQGDLTGGDPRTVYRIAAGFTRSVNGNTISGADTKGNLTFSLDTKSANQRLGASILATYGVSRSNLIAMSGPITMAPNAPPVYDSLGNLNYAGWSPNDRNYPFGNIKSPYTAKTNFINSSIELHFEITRGLVIKTNLGYNYGQTGQTSYKPIASQDPALRPLGVSQFGNNNNRNWIIEPQLTYDASLGKGKLSALVGATEQDTYTEGQYVVGSGYTSDALLRTITNAPQQYASDLFAEYKYAALFGRLNYNWEDKYILNLTARRDGSSRFGPGKQYGNFAAAGLAWIFTEEHWMPKLKFLSFGKLRASYGSTGSDNVGLYQYLTRWSSNGLQPYAGITPLNPLQHANPDYQWQVNKKLEGAIELGFLDNTINLNVAYYRDRCGNQLIDFPLPYFTGFPSVTGNLPAVVQNSGLEFRVSAKIIHTKSVTWSVRWDMGINRNKLIAFPNLATSFFAHSFIVGQPLNLTRLLHYTGVDPQTGQYTFEDRNHDGVISTNPGPTDDRFVHDLTPKYLGGWGTDFSYKGLQVSVFFSYIHQIAQNAIAQGANPGLDQNQPTLILGKEWKQPGDIASVARFTTQPQQSDGWFYGSDAGYSDDSYMRLRYVSLTYNFSEQFVHKAALQNASIFLRGDNLLVITRYKGLDPEVHNFGSLPPEKIVTAGITLTF